MKKFVFYSILIICAIMMCGCSKKEESATPVTDGFFTSGQFSIGGGTEAEEVNAKTLISSTQTVDGVEETVLTFTFVSGSLISAGSTEEECPVPMYTIYTLDSPARLVVDIDNLDYWDYRRTFEYDGELITGSFRHSLFGSPRTSIYFQLSSRVRFLAEASGDSLTIRLRREEPQVDKSFFVTANAYDDYRSGIISSETDLTPTLAGDYTNILMISPAFSSENDAEEYRRATAELYPAIDAGMWRIVELESGTLPEYDETLDYLHVYKTPAVRLNDGSEYVLPVRVQDGLYLCSLPDDSGFLYSKELAADDGEEAYQQLYVMRNDGRRTPATAFEFVGIEQAKFSPDGRKLAVLERTSVSTHLYVFDADTYELINDLSEMGFGGSTSTYIWNSLGNTIYAITGDNDIQLHQFDYSIPDETQRHDLIDRNTVDEGSLGFADGELYFTVATMEEGSMIYKIKPEGGVRKPFMKGGRFIISEDSRYMAIADTSESSTSGNTGNSLILYEFATGKSVEITDRFYPYDFIWSEDCSQLYYIESRIYGGQNESETSDIDEEETIAETDAYPYTLWVYDVRTAKNEKLMDMCAPDIFPTGINTALFLNRIEGDDAAIRATYFLDLTAAFEGGSDIISMSE